MKQGGPIPSHPDNKATSDGELNGLRLSVYRAPISPAGVSAISTVCVVPGAGTLALASRFSMRVEFDLPYAQLAYIPQPSAIGPHPPPTGTNWPTPWAVGLLVKSGNENDTGDPKIPVTCQFNRTVNAVRLNSPKPGSLQNDQAGNLDAPVDYAKYWAPRVILPASRWNLRSVATTRSRWGTQSEADPWPSIRGKIRGFSRALRFPRVAKPRSAPWEFRL